MKEETASLTGDRLLAILAALDNPHRLRIIAALASSGRNYVSQLARELGISRPLLHLHLQKLQSAGLVSSQLELSQDGKALNYFEVNSFNLALTPAAIAAAVTSGGENPPRSRIDRPAIPPFPVRTENMHDISLFRLYLLRALYLLIVVGLGATVWPGVLYGAHQWALMEGTVVCMLAAFSILAALGLRYPLQMLPVLLWKLVWKTLWLFIVALPQWWAGRAWRPAP